ncbi:hypothetical protein [Massilia phyllosphaerae]|uniref:hypothetical protein n=1 Tax=Massilia phyllosphaerae TaxID=3106034 RepID=UPI002B1CD429|nr:hypothetical protein [Massilia sp. SGZ-792]
MTSSTTTGQERAEGRSVRDIVEHAHGEVTEAWCRKLFRQLLQALERQYAMEMPHRVITADTVVFHQNGQPLLLPSIASDPVPTEADDLTALAKLVHYAITQELLPSGPLHGRGLDGYSEALLTAVDRCMDPDPAQRPQTVAELRDILGIVPPGSAPLPPPPALSELADPLAEPVLVDEAAPAAEPAPVTEPTPVEAEPASVTEPLPLPEPPPLPEPIPTAEPVPVIEPTPVAEPVPMIRPVPVMEPARVVAEPAAVPVATPVAEPVPMAEPAPVAEPVAVTEPAPVAKPAMVPEPHIQPQPQKPLEAAIPAHALRARADGKGSERPATSTSSTPAAAAAPAATTAAPTAAAPTAPPAQPHAGTHTAAPHRRPRWPIVAILAAMVLVGYALLPSNAPHDQPAPAVLQDQAGPQAPASVNIPAASPDATTAPAAPAAGPALQPVPSTSVQNPGALPAQPPAAAGVAPAATPGIVPAMPAGAGATASVAPGAAAPNAGATYQLHIQPWGTVYVDGVDRGVSPPIKRLQLPAGRHTVRVTNPNFQERVLDVDTSAGDGRIVVDFSAAE